MYTNMTQLIGGTPLIRVERYEKANNLQAHIAIKLESANPTSSAKDRAALAMVLSAEQSGQLKQGGTIVEPTSGNTGVALAAIAAARGYKAIFTMPESMSVERRALISAYGAEIVLTSAALGMQGAVDKAMEICREQSAFMPNQFTNMDNPKAHYNTTGPEIWQDCGQELAAFVAGVGTGGTLSGAGQYLKEKNTNIYIVAVEPDKSPLLSGGTAAGHGIMGIGANFIPKTLNRNIYDEVQRVTDEAAYSAARSLAATEGLLVGISTGAALAAAGVLAQRDDFKDRLIAVIAPDTGERYLSTPLFAY
ncbi:MAG: cysteine synthase A [Oscillospiraceae bacterium]